MGFSGHRASLYYFATNTFSAVRPGDPGPLGQRFRMLLNGGRHAGNCI